MASPVYLVIDDSDDSDFDLPAVEFQEAQPMQNETQVLFHTQDSTVIEFEEVPETPPPASPIHSPPAVRRRMLVRDVNPHPPATPPPVMLLDRFEQLELFCAAQVAQDACADLCRQVPALAMDVRIRAADGVASRVDVAGQPVPWNTQLHDMVRGARRAVRLPSCPFCDCRCTAMWQSFLPAAARSDEATVEEIAEILATFSD